MKKKEPFFVVDSCLATPFPAVSHLNVKHVVYSSCYVKNNITPLTDK